MMVTTGGRGTRFSSSSVKSSATSAASAVCSCFRSRVISKSEQTSCAVSKSISLLMVAMLPSMNSFLMISPAGLPIFSVRSRTVMVSPAM